MDTVEPIVRVGHQGVGRARLVGDPGVRGRDRRQARQGCHRTVKQRGDRRASHGTATLGLDRALDRRGGRSRLDATDVILATGSAPKLLPGLRSSARDHHERPGALRRPHPGIGRRDRRRRGGPRVRVDVPVVRRGGHADRGAPPARAAGGRGDLQGGRAGVPQARDHDRRGRVRHRDRRRPATASTSPTTPTARARRSPPTSAWSRSAAARSRTASGSRRQASRSHEKGFVKVDGQLRTNVAARLGGGRRRRDAAAARARRRSPRAIAVAERIAGIDVPAIDYANIPRVTYCTPGDRERRTHGGAGARARHARS